MKCAPSAPNGPNHLGFCVLQVRGRCRGRFPRQDHSGNAACCPPAARPPAARPPHWCPAVFSTPLTAAGRRTTFRSRRATTHCVCRRGRTPARSSRPTGTEACGFTRTSSSPDTVSHCSIASSLVFALLRLLHLRQQQQCPKKRSCPEGMQSESWKGSFTEHGGGTDMGGHGQRRPRTRAMTKEAVARSNRSRQESHRVCRLPPRRPRAQHSCSCDIASTGGLIDEDDREAVETRVRETFQAINEANKKAKS